MSKTIFIISVLCFLIIISGHVAGQGCSDAGFCTINSFQPNDNDSTSQLKNQAKIGFSYGDADHSITAYGAYIEYNRQFNSKLGIDIKLTSLAQNGNNISVSGLSDIYLNANYSLNEKLRFTVGTKIPLSNSNKTKNNLPLPMDYQASLGTFDLIFGIGYQIKKIQLVAALQQPLTQNDNQFIAENNPTTSPLRDFQSTNKFMRSSDVLLRISYPFYVNKMLRVTPSILPIYHLTNDKYTDVMAIEKEISGSQGLTLNGNIFLDFEFAKKHALQLILGMPFVVRDARPDGLTRSLIANLEYRIKF